MNIIPLGDSALLLRLREQRDPAKAIEALRKVEAALRAARLPGVVEIVPAFSTIAVFYDPAAVGDEAAPHEHLAERVLQAARSRGRTRRKTPARHEIPVCYDAEFGPDLSAVAEASGLAPKEASELHASAQYRVGAVGFAPGFPYLRGLPEVLATPRRATPRTRVAPGSVGIGGSHTGIYPRESPGGWNIIGRTPTSMFDLDRDPPALLALGDIVRFRPITRQEFDDISTPRPKQTALARSTAAAIILRAGFQSSVQDLGRVGHRACGVTPAGVLDRHALAALNLLVGNKADAAGIEATAGRMRLAVENNRTIVWAGGDFAVRIGRWGIPAGRPALLAAGDELSIEATDRGARLWLAISGGIAVPEILGSRSTDLRGGFGGMEGRALRDGDRLPLGDAVFVPPRDADRLASVAAPFRWVQPALASPLLRIVRGADWARFEKPVRQSLFTQVFCVGPDSDRMGVRLKGEPLVRNEPGDLLSEAVAPGTIQVPPSGEPIILLGDCQTLGGYPKIAHVITVDLAIAAQLRPGDEVRFDEVSLAQAQRLLLERARDFAWFRTALELRPPWS